MNIETIMIQNLRLLDVAKVIGEWISTIIVEEDVETSMAKRITSRDIFGLVGSATGEEALAILKAKNDKKEAAVVAAAAKKDETKEKRAKDITAFVITGSEILRRLEQSGPDELLRLKVDELYALLVNADPQGSIPRSNKKTGQEKASRLLIVIAALGRFSGSNSIATPAEAPQMLPIPEAPLSCEGTNTENMQVSAPADFYLPIFDRVFPYAPDASGHAEVTGSYV
jgi:hypothetical protein